ncbi:MULTISPECIES: alpha/beta fold hydrolase [unclassified Moraxella]|uniref:alpha/beta hydrolase family protein n=1 Tax=unclassified Moraxella TaxID=2685852 RepID=UPI003AF6EB4E
MSTQDIRVATDHHTNLTATIYTPNTDNSLAASSVKAGIMLAPATGIKRQFYHNFAQFLADNGYGVMTFDNEGIGDSLEGDIAKSNASLISWGRYDMTAILDKLMQTFPNTSYHLIGHSAGGQLFGLMPNHDKLTSVFNVACSSGQIRNMAMPYRAKAMYFMDVFIPMSNLIFGYTKTSKVGMGEDLPKQVAKQWRDWCNGSGYIKTAFGKTVQTHYYDEVKLPTLWVNAPDDDIANDKNVADMIRVFPNIQATTKTLNPKDYGLKHIGHMKFFSRQNQVLWQQAVDWLEKHA